MRIAAHAVFSDRPGVRGTALEYLENVVPDAVRAPLLKRLGADRPRPQTRTDTRDALLKSAVMLVIAEEKPEEL
jgi:hypothetical protein